MPPTTLDNVVSLARKGSLLRPKDLDRHDIPRQYLKIAVDRGLIRRVGRGLYVTADAAPTETHSLVQAARKVPHGVICLLSALQFHEVGTQAPFQVWLAVDRKAWLPRTDSPPLRVVRFSGRALTWGVERHRLEGVVVPVYSLPKTIADCFKYRNKIGLDVALEALRDAWQHRRVTLDALAEAAAVCRVSNIMRPYLEALT